jgi:tRNA-specific 2-thiouridylase
MSGGLDSSVAAWLLTRSGEALAGLSMLLWDQSGEPGQGRCCGALDLADARRVAQQCGLPHYVISMEEEFRRHVVEPYVEDYLAGMTPNPCTQCNTWIKFDFLLARARAIGASHIATGHYARIVETNNGWQLHRANNEEKDQSYYLFELTQEQLEIAKFPLGEMSKDEVRQMARDAGLIVAEKGESMDTCFVSQGVREFVERQVAASPDRFDDSSAGVGATVLDSTGARLGRGEPYYRYTVGQRKGLGVAAGERLYVLQVKPEHNAVVVGREHELMAPGLIGERTHWIGSKPVEPIEVEVKIRSRHPGITATVSCGPNGEANVEFSEPQRGVAPGQAAVFYQGTRVLGGCWIKGAPS